MTIKNKVYIMRMIFSVLFIINVMGSICYADETDTHIWPEGWHWGNERIEQKKEDEPIDPIVEMNTENEAILRALYTARKHPTKENVKSYIAMQNQVVQESKTFSNVWKSVLLENPTLDYSIKHPTNNYARIIESDQQKQREENAVHALAKQSGLFFFYRSTCPYCRAFASTVKQFSEMYGIKVIPITTDGIPLPEFPESYINHGQAEKFHVTVEPALFAVNPYTQKAFPITYGLISLVDLKKRIFDIATKFDGDSR